MRSIDTWMKKSIVGLLSYWLMACTPEVPILGLDIAGVPVNVKVPKKAYVDSVSKNIDRLQIKILPALSKQKKSPSIELKELGVGLNIKVDTKIQSIRLGGSAGIWLMFRKD